MPYSPQQQTGPGSNDNLESLVNGQNSPTGFPFESTLTVADENNFYIDAFSWEPKYQNRFIMSEAGGIPAFLIKSSAKPSMTNGSVTLDHINVQRYVKGKTVWNTIDISIYDAIIPSAAQKCIEWIREHHESATGRDGYSSFYKKDITLESLSPLGEVIEEWTLKGTYLESVNFGSLDWATEGAVEISATLRYDWAFLNF